MTTRMIHPQHGATHAYDGGEIERLTRLGWTAESAPTTSPAPKTQEPERKKPGPKPKAK